MSIDDIGQAGADDELFAGLHRSVAGATMTASAADVVALGRRTRTRQRAVAAGVGTSVAGLVAAIGVLAPSAGTGGGGAQTMVIQDAGFRLQKGADGAVDVAVYDTFEPVRLKAAFDRAGIKSDVQEVDLPADWNDSTIPDCAATPGVRRDPRVNDEAAKQRQSEGVPPALKIELSGGYLVFPILPAGDVISMVRFHHDFGGSTHVQFMNALAIMTGTPGKCVPVPAHSPQAAGLV